MKYCPYCGGALKEDMLFCPKCGKPFEDAGINPNVAEEKVFAKESTKTEIHYAEHESPGVKNKAKVKRPFLIVVLVAILALGAFVGRTLFSSNRGFSNNTKGISNASNSVVKLSCYDKNDTLTATGSGFVVFENDIIVTNYHVIEREAYRVIAQTESGDSFDCPYVVGVDKKRDIAILKAEKETGLSPLKVGSSSDLKKGEQVVAIGSPLGLINSVSTGVFSGVINDKMGNVLQFTAAISHGSSGGALFNDKGEVIGITYASITEGQNLNLAVPIEEAQALYLKAIKTTPQKLSELYKPYAPTLPSSINAAVNVNTLSFEEFKREREIAEEIGIGGKFTDLCSKGYRLFLVNSSEIINDLDYEYYIRIANEMGVDEETATRYLLGGYRFYRYEN